MGKLPNVFSCDFASLICFMLNYEIDTPSVLDRKFSFLVGVVFEIRFVLFSMFLSSSEFGNFFAKFFYLLFIVSVYHY